MLSESPIQESGNDSSALLKSERNLSSFMEMGRYCDYTVVDSNRIEHKLHRVVLACHSDYFQAIFESQFSESLQKRSTLTFPDPRSVLTDVFKFMYTSQISVSPETVIPILNQSEYYQVTELSQLLKKQIEREFLPKHVVRILQDAVEFRMVDVVEKASAVLAENFDAIEWTQYGDELNFLPFDVFLNILDNRALTLDTEYRVYKVIANYTRDWSLKPKLASVVDDPSAVRAMTVEDCNEIYSKVFFEHLTVEQLEEAYENPHVPRNLLCEGMFISLRMALGKPVNQERLGRTYTKHMDTKRGRDFVYSGQDFDTNGVVHWLGTQLDEKTFQNPHLTGHVECKMSTVQTGKPAHLVSRQNIPTCTMSQPASWISIDLSPSHFVLRPTHYTLKHGFWRDNVNLKRWLFQGSTDGQTWDTIAAHESDQLGGEYGTQTFSVEKCERWYCSFRIMTVGKFFVQISGIELYGNLLPRTLDAAFKRRQLNSRSGSDSMVFQ